MEYRNFKLSYLLPLLLFADKQPLMYICQAQLFSHFKVSVFHWSCFVVILEQTVLFLFSHGANLSELLEFSAYFHVFKLKMFYNTHYAIPFYIILQYILIIHYVLQALLSKTNIAQYWESFKRTEKNCLPLDLYYNNIVWIYCHRTLQPLSLLGLLFLYLFLRVFSFKLIGFNRFRQKIQRLKVLYPQVVERTVCAQITVDIV